MRIFCYAVLPLLALAPALSAAADATAEFRPIVEKVYQAWSTLDISKPAPYYAKDAHLLYFDLAPLKYNNWAEYEKGFAQAIADWKSVKITIQPDLLAWKQGNTAWAAATAKFELHLKSGKDETMMIRLTEIFEKRGNKWLIVHEHVSAPLP